MRPPRIVYISSSTTMKHFRRFLLLAVLALAATSLIASSRYEIHFPRQSGPQFDRHVRRKYVTALEEQQPEFVLMGDSTLEAAVDPELLEASIQRPVMQIAIDRKSVV